MIDTVSFENFHTIIIKKFFTGIRTQINGKIIEVKKNRFKCASSFLTRFCFKRFGPYSLGETINDDQNKIVSLVETFCIFVIFNKISHPKFIWKSSYDSSSWKCFTPYRCVNSIIIIISQKCFNLGGKRGTFCYVFV